MAPALPIKFQELLQLSSLGVNQTAITFNTCVRHTQCAFLAIPPFADYYRGDRP
jgi:hypothetical protein